jgi:hypothetical protein
MPDIRSYMIPATFDLPAFSSFLRQHMTNELKLETQSISGDSGVILQGREQSTVKRFVGMDKAITVKISISDQLMNVEVGQGKWIDKAAGAAVAWFLFWPAIVTTAIGTVQQAQLPGKIFAFIQDCVSMHRKESQPKKACGHCGSAMNADDIFCRSCGERA